jgi:hypothetical protein
LCVYFFSANVLRPVVFFSVVADFAFRREDVARVLRVAVVFGASEVPSAAAVASAVFFVVLFATVRRWGFLASAAGAADGSAG